jgi:membrane-bound metal-dependent hydrolase YbcI (DUF457 family)
MPALLHFFVVLTQACILHVLGQYANTQDFQLPKKVMRSTAVIWLQVKKVYPLLLIWLHTVAMILITNE